MKSLRWRIALVVAVVIAGIVCNLPSTGIYGYFLPVWLQGVLPEEGIKTGIDKNGCGYFSLELDFANLPKNVEPITAFGRASNIVKTRLEKQEIHKLSTQIDEKENVITFTLPTVKEESAVNDILKRIRLYGNIPIFLKQFLPQKLINLGLDLQGGSHLVLAVDTEGMSRKEAKDVQERALVVIRNRIDEFGVAEPIVIPVKGRNRIIIELPGIREPERIKEIIRRQAVLEFKLVCEDKDKIKQALAGKVPDGYDLSYLARTKDDGTIYKEPYLLEAKSALSSKKGELLTNAYVTYGQMNQSIVAIKFNRKGSKAFARLTGSHIGERLATLLDGKLKLVATIQDRIIGEGRITGVSAQEAPDLANVLKSGALPAQVEILEERTVGPSLGADSIRKGIRAGILGLIVVFCFVMIYYMFLGLIAGVALCLNLVIIMAALASFSATLTLPGIAAIILTIGMAVDANVLIFERIREELSSGKTIRASIGSGYQKAFRTIVDANVTTLIAAVVLYQFGTGPIRGFAVTLTLGILASMFTAIVVTRVILDLFCRRRSFVSIKMLQLFHKPNLDFVNKRFIALGLSLILILVGMTGFFIKGEENFGIDFTGGKLIQLRFIPSVSIGAIRRVLKNVGLGKSVIQQFGSENDLIIKMPLEVKDNITNLLRNSFKDIDITEERTEMVGAQVGRDLRNQAVLAIIFAMIGILAYVTWRFELRFAIGAILALAHDVLITMGAFAIMGKEITLPIVAALLTIVGYSLNDTIVVFDRIRDNVRFMKKSNEKEIINASINQTLSRTVLTSVTTLFVVVSLFYLGGEVIHDFAFALIVGVIVGTYSSIYIASPTLLMWQKFKSKS
ncbi:MAG: protein translocase subunit SecD [bacterium]|nr:protein translocase subunit SecD [bacterium]